MDNEHDCERTASPVHEDFLALLKSAPDEGALGPLLGPGPCTSPEDLKRSLPVKKKYLGPGPWYAYLKQRFQEERNDQD